MVLAANTGELETHSSSGLNVPNNCTGPYFSLLYKEM